MKCGYINCKKEIAFSIKRTKKFCSGNCRAAQYYYLNPDRKKIQAKNNYEKNKENNKVDPDFKKRRQKSRKKYYEKNKEKENRRSSEWIKDNPEKTRLTVCKSLRNARYKLKTSYIKDLLKSNGITVPSDDIIELKREYLKLIRKIYEKQRNTTNIK